MKKLICLLLQVVSLCMWLVYIDKERVGVMLNIQSIRSNDSFQVVYIMLATTILFLAIIGFLVPDRPSNKNTI